MFWLDFINELSLSCYKINISFFFYCIHYILFVFFNTIKSVIYPQFFYEMYFIHITLMNVIIKSNGYSLIFHSFLLVGAESDTCQWI